MGAIDGGTLVLLLCLGSGAIALALVGIISIRSRRRGLPADLTLAWHQQPRLLFGINNLVFACLLLFIFLLILLSGSALRYALFALIGLALILSIALLISSLLASLHLATRLHEHARAAKQADMDHTQQNNS